MHRAHRSLWILTALTVLAAGLVSQALTARAGPVSDGLLALSVVLLVITGTLLTRVLRYLSRAAAPAASRNTADHPDRADDPGDE
jgi:uncharacterized membrane protein